MDRIQIVNKGIVSIPADAIVNAANEGLRMGGGVCGVIFRKAGIADLSDACDKIGHCPTGGAVITPAFKLPAKFVIHTVGPVWRGGDAGEAQLLYDCYQNSLKLALENGCHSIVFPLVSAGIFGYPKEAAWKRALESCRDFLQANPDSDITIYFAVIDQSILKLGEKVKASL